ncbi:DOM34-interacting protein 2 [Anopheles sinensis]|uniref:DOM34-interacting protein 2 n=1 Tax=Anopheles sinensis TaxID=74873 RepID=A0A084VMG6_ANOSI|nr:DOM34-interacting protein 2 [Anopheles sinensis]
MFRVLCLTAERRKHEDPSAERYGGYRQRNIKPKFVATLGQPLGSATLVAFSGRLIGGKSRPQPNPNKTPGSEETSSRKKEDSETKGQLESRHVNGNEELLCNICFNGELIVGGWRANRSKDQIHRAAEEEIDSDRLYPAGIVGQEVGCARAWNTRSGGQQHKYDPRSMCSEAGRLPKPAVANLWQPDSVRCLTLQPPSGPITFPFSLCSSNLKCCCSVVD